MLNLQKNIKFWNDTVSYLFDNIAHGHSTDVYVAKTLKSVPNNKLIIDCDIDVAAIEDKSLLNSIMDSPILYYKR